MTNIKKDFFANSLMKVLFYFMIISFLGIIPLLIIGFLSSKSIIILIVGFFISLSAIIISIYLYVLINKPLFEISRDKIIFKALNSLWKRNIIECNKIKGFAIEIINTSPLVNMQNNFEVLKLIIKDEYKSKYDKSLRFNLKTVGNKDELLESLQAFLPDLTAASNEKLLDLTELKKELQFKKYLLTHEGIKINNKEIITWNKITEIKVNNFSNFYYKGIKIYYQKNNKRKSLKVSPKFKQDYIYFLRYIIEYATEAKINPIIFNMFKVTPEEANYERRISIINICLIILLFALYSLNIFDRYIFEKKYLLITAPAIIFYLEFIITFKIYRTTNLLYGDYTNIYKYYKKTLLSFMFLIFSLILLIVFTPGAADFLQGDLYFSANNPEKSIIHYQNVLMVYPENVEVLYTTAKTFYHLENYEQSFQLMSKAYNHFVGKWNPHALKLLPESLKKLERYDDARDWCERILHDSREDKYITEVIQEIMDDIEDL